MKLFTTLSFCLCLTYFAQGQGDTLTQTFVHNDSLRSYLLYVPDDYDGSEDWPLVINYHGFGITAGTQMELSQMNAVADTAHFLIAYPQGLPVFSPVLNSFGPGWNPINGLLSNTDDISFSNQLISEINSMYQVDQARIYTTGWSMGATMAWQTACALPDRVAAVAAVSQQMADLQIADCDPGRAFSTLLIHGTRDSIAWFNGDGVFFSASPLTPRFWADYNNCFADSTVTVLPDLVTSDSSTVTLIQYTGCDDGTEVLFYRIDGGSHSWPGGVNLFPQLGNYNQDINASSEIWNFFNRNPHPDPPGEVLSKSFVHNDSLRSYLLYVPYDYDGSEDWPLVISMHGYALNSGFQMAYSDMNAVADTAHFLIAYPQGTTIVSTVPNIPPQGLGWNVSLASDTTFVSPGNVDDVDFIRQVIDSIQIDFQVAPKRIYATGFSNGAMMSHLLALKLNDQIAAIAAVGGTIPKSQLSAHTGTARIPVFHIHGTADSIAFYSGDGFLASVPEIMQYWANQNGCSMDPTVSMLPDLTMSDSTTLELQEWPNCAAEVMHLKVTNGGHQWPGGVNLLPFLGHFNLDVHGSTEIWKFFNRNELADVSTSIQNDQPLILEHLKIYPNPFNERFTVELELAKAQSLQMRLVNLLGQTIGQRRTFELSSGKHRLQWDKGEQILPAGLYYLQLLMNGRQLSWPLVYQSNLKP